MEDWQLLQDYAEHGSESAFRTLVGRHLGLVQAAALRQVNRSALAEEAVQAVFILLARKARKLSRQTALAGWLFQTTRFVALRTLRSEFRRQWREQEAVNMQELSRPDETWRRIAPELDEGLERLGRAERNAVLLRFFEDKNHQQVGSALGITEEAAKKRVNRGLDKLRAFFARRGFAVSAAVLSTALAANASAVAPAGLEASIASGALAGGSAASAALPALVQQALTAWRLAKLKLAGVLGGAGVAVGLVVNAVVQTTDREPDPDPVVLLKNVAQARKQIVSGEMEFEVTQYDFGRPLDGTNQLQLKTVFDGEKRRFESFDREYSYVLMGPDAGTVTDAKRKELGLDREATVRAGLLTEFDSHHFTAYDGALLLDYWETDGRPFQTKIDDPAKGSGTYVFDPRILGLTPSPGITDTIESCLASNGAPAQLIGKESVEGVASWHVRVPSHQQSFTYDFWVDAGHPNRVVKQSFNGNTVFSKYDVTKSNDPIPTEVWAVNFYTRERTRVETRYLRQRARFNVPVDPASWTLAGLNMQVGTAVVDYRISRRIGYWDGSGLSENLPLRTPQASKPRSPPSPAKLLALVEQDPKSPFALEAATWIILNSPDGPEVEQAAETIRREHARNEKLAYLCQELEKSFHRSAPSLLRTVLEANPHAEVQAAASFSLAAILKRQAMEGAGGRANEQAASEAERLFERVMVEHRDVKSGEGTLGDRAQTEAFELRHLRVGKVASEIEGIDLDGQIMRLSDHRGKVVVLTFWGTWCGPCMAMVPDERKLVERLAGKPFALIGVNSDDNQAKLKAAIKKEMITWPSFRDGSRGRIAKDWNVHSWPTTYVLDRDGIIRYRNVRGKALDEAVNALLRERE
jgi:RNA polymerase sigma factor (sigma-70 family)